MINPSECAEMVGLTDVRIKQIMREMFPPEEIFRTSPKKGQIKVTPEQTREILKKRGFGYKPSIAMFANEKGGVGKSLITINVAVKQAYRGARVLLIDLDPESCATNFLLKEEDIQKDLTTVLEVLQDNKSFSDAIMPTRYPLLDIVPCRGRSRRAEKYAKGKNLGKLLRAKLAKAKKKYDLILFEVPPTFSDVVASAYITSDIVVIPTFPDIWSLESVALTIEDVTEEAKKWKTKLPDIKVILNKFRADRTASKEAWAIVIEEFPGYILPYHIKESAHLQNSINNGQSVFENKSPKIVKESLALLGELVSPVVRLKGRTKSGN